ncbi:aminoglycoside adenylyltransferase domain-containing protein [Actinoplanes sp. NPDC089786]|uniref:aminoglycoside adenylyltransferase domain-containing protein n=1 Tax=Actinoplanes sp. NPDC089786 TaxID=3155185 RepID=UPI0034292DEF
MSISRATSLARSCAAVTGGTVILHGSLALGGYRPGRSDIDLLLITSSPLPSDAVPRLLSIASGAPLDLHVVSSAVVARPTSAPGVLLYAGHGDVAVDVPSDPDFVVELSVARAHGVTLVGSDPPDAVIGPVPASWVVDRGRYWLTRWRELTDDVEHARFMVLTACRMWRFAVEGAHSPKAEAGRWALERDPSLVAITAALADAPIPPPEISRVLNAALHRS